MGPNSQLLYLSLRNKIPNIPTAVKGVRSGGQVNRQLGTLV